ncbi:unnamed protein product [Brachionus calyciflorus]|uniref:C-CAP/cofactor C-like domain-containing protein n=1 Tax=Brachionus calyciflorus TaxID=104777 RepID=A0A814F260_9BILA|nr:unnamed protein product [Brachionus calyciflorus]
MDAEVFQKHFYSEHQQITSALNSLCKNSDDNDEKLRLSTEYEKISSRIEILQKYFSESTSFIPGFEIRKAQEYMGQLSRLAQEKRDEIFPKKKFGFKSKQKMTSLESAIQKAETLTPQIGIKEDTLNFNDANSIMIRDLKEQTCIKLEDELNGKDIAIVNCKNSTIQLFGNPSVVHVANIDTCTILCGPLTGTAFINQAINSKIIIASHQLRIHDSRDTQFYIHVGSRAIIENCKQVKFGAYAWTYPKLETHFEKSKLNLEKLGVYNWQLIDDFNWLNQEIKSPNWSFVNEEDKLKWFTSENGQLEIVH